MQLSNMISISSPKLPSRLTSKRPPSCSKRRSLRRIIVASARGDRSSNGRGRGGRLVDENMVVLRMRIKEMKMLEGESEEERCHLDWMEWEKKYCLHYYEDVCEGIGILQNYLMNVRPCLGLGLIGIFLLSVPISTWVVFVHALEIFKLILSGFFHF